MKRLLALLVLVLLAFYVAWPGWTGYRISNAIKAKDAAALEASVAFPEVRESLKPAAVQKLGEIYDQQLKSQVGPTGASIVNQIKADVIPKIVDNALTQVVTAPNLIRVVSGHGTLKENAERILREEVGKTGLPGISGGSGAGGIKLPAGIKLPGGLGEIVGGVRIPGLGGAGGGAGADTGSVKQEPAGEPRGFGVGNVKRFGFLGPLAFEIGIAKDAKASEADVNVEMRFVGGDWRVVAVRPRL